MNDKDKLELIGLAITDCQNHKMDEFVFYQIVSSIIFPAKITKEDIEWADSVLKERKDKNKMEIDNQECKCGHLHLDHSLYPPHNYSAGRCYNCDCEHFIIKN